jgi:sugar phosphate isomerase/epimerase
MQWGYALVWAGQYLKRDPDPIYAKLKFLEHYGLKTTGIGIGELAKMDDAARGKLFDYLAAHPVAFTLIPHADFCHASLDDARRQVDFAIDCVRKYAKAVKAPISHMGVARLHRFMRDPSLAWQMQRLAQILPPLAQACKEAGAPLSIENHGDYYVSDLVGLCKAVKDLFIFFDTGNTYLIGEQPILAAEAAAPFVIGGHWKDHRVQPVANNGPLRFEVGASVIGEGDVPLREIYAILKARTPHFDRVAMEIELIQPSFSGNDPVDAVEKSVAFCRSLET